MVVDPGDAAPVERFLETHQLILDAILITHHHADHVGGVGSLNRTRSVPVYGPGAEHIDCVTHAIGEGDTVDLPKFVDFPFRVLEVPGHTSGHIAYLSGSILFCGDTLFAAGCGRLFEGTAAQLHHSLMRLAELPEATRVYCTHEYTLSNLHFALAVDGDNEAVVARSFVEQSRRERGEPTLPSTIALERATNPFLRCAVPGVMQRARDHLNQTASQVSGAARPLTEPRDVFATLRQWKNEFRG